MSSAAASTNMGSKGKKHVSRSTKAGLIFPVGRVARILKAEKYANRASTGAPVYLSAVLEYLATELLELSGKMAKDRKKKRITPTHIKEALESDEEFEKLVGNVTVPTAGVIPNIHPKLLPKGTGKST